MTSERDRGILHLDVGALLEATLDAIRRGDREAVQAHLAFVDELERDGDEEVQNAIGVSYLEHLDFDGRKAAAIGLRALLTPRLVSVVGSLHR